MHLGNRHLASKCVLEGGIWFISASWNVAFGLEVRDRRRLLAKRCALQAVFGLEARLEGQWLAQRGVLEAVLGLEVRLGGRCLA